MKSRVIQVPDLSGFQADPELTTVVVSDEEIQEKLNHLAKECGTLEELTETAADCGVICEDAAGKKVFLYPSLGLPEAAQAEADVAGKKPGDTFVTQIAGEEKILKVQKILLRRSCEINDELAQRAGIEGVSTLQELKVWIENEIKQGKCEKQKRMLVMQIHQYLCDNAITQLDEEEIGAWTREQARLSYAENLEMGIDLRFTEAGEMLSEEEVLAQIADDMRMPFVSMLVNQKYCEDHGFTTDKEGMEAEEECFPYVYQELTKIAEEMMA